MKQHLAGIISTQTNQLACKRACLQSFGKSPMEHLGVSVVYQNSNHSKSCCPLFPNVQEINLEKH